MFTYCTYTFGTYLPEGGLKSVPAAGPLPVAQPVAQPHQDCSDRATSCLSLSLEAYKRTYRSIVSIYKMAYPNNIMRKNEYY